MKCFARDYAKPAGGTRGDKQLYYTGPGFYRKVGPGFTLIRTIITSHARPAGITDTAPRAIVIGQALAMATEGAVSHRADAVRLTTASLGSVL